MLFTVSTGALVAYAMETESGPEFSTVEQEGSLLEASEGQQQVREVRLEELQEERRREEERLAEEKRIEEERIRVEAEAVEAEERERARIAEEEQQEKEKEKVAQVEDTPKEKEVKSATSNKAPSNPEPTTTGSNLGTFQATAYGPDCVGCSGVTANGTDIRNGNIYTSAGYRVIAADPGVIPMGSVVRVTFSSGETMMAQVADTGGAIKGKIIDIAYPSEAEANPFGRQQVQIEIIN